MPSTNLPPISAADIVFYLVLLTAHFLLHGPVLLTIATVLRCIPFLLLKLPFQLVRARWFYQHGNRPQGAIFQQVVLRCMKYGFINLPTSVARGFFEASVIIPFYTFRLLRCGMYKSKEWPEWRWVDQNEVSWAVCEC